MYRFFPLDIAIHKAQPRGDIDTVSTVSGDWRSATILLFVPAATRVPKLFFLLYERHNGAGDREKTAAEKKESETHWIDMRAANDAKIEYFGAAKELLHSTNGDI